MIVVCNLTNRLMAAFSQTDFKLHLHQFQWSHYFSNDLMNCCEIYLIYSPLSLTLLPAGGDFCHLLITFACSLDQDHA